MQGAALLDAGGRSKLTEVIRAWGFGAKLDTSRFAAHFLSLTANDPLVEPPRSAARAADLADSPAASREAAIRLAGVMQSVGLDRWRSFLAHAQARARDPATIAAAQESIGPRDPLRDAIRPVYPLETLLGIAASGSAGGAAAAARTVGGALLRQVLPRKPAPNPLEAPTRIVPKLLQGHQHKHIIGTNNYHPARNRSILTADAQTFLDKYAGRGRQVGKIPVGQPGSKEVFDTGNETIGIFKRSGGSISQQTTRGIIHYGSNGAHIVPADPMGW